LRSEGSLPDLSAGNHAAKESGRENGWDSHWDHVVNEHFSVWPPERCPLLFRSMNVNEFNAAQFWLISTSPLLLQTKHGQTKAHGDQMMVRGPHLRITDAWPNSSSAEKVVLIASRIGRLDHQMSIRSQ